VITQKINQNVKKRMRNRKRSSSLGKENPISSTPEKIDKKKKIAKQNLLPHKGVKPGGERAGQTFNGITKNWAKRQETGGSPT